MSRLQHRRVSALAAALAACAFALAGCGKGEERADETASAESAALERKAPAEAPAAPSTADRSAAAPAAAPQQAAPTPPKYPKYPREGWSKVAIDNDLPLCVFASNEERFNAKFKSDAKKQTLRAGSTVVFGVFGPGCINEACDDLPSLQCIVQRDGNTLIVRSRYWGYHKDGTTCTETCRPVYAGCETPELEAGKYTVKHGEQTFELKIPSVRRNPCFEPK